VPAHVKVIGWGSRVFRYPTLHKFEQSQVTLVPLGRPPLFERPESFFIRQLAVAMVQPPQILQDLAGSLRFPKLLKLIPVLDTGWFNLTGSIDAICSSGWAFTKRLELQTRAPAHR
jgi:hypothetical protein